MSRIFQLSSELANQIAAGEVVERPVSVVKELVENSLDAGASRIQIVLLSGGMQEIIVQDNGTGIDPRDIAIVTNKYTTSKIRSIEDLHKIMTFGFRWEALASISSVSDFELISKIATEIHAKKLFFENWKQKIIDYPLDTGTKIRVKNLFAKTPARLNYLKSEKTEYNHILEYIQSISIFYPQTTFELISEGEQVFFTPSADDMGQRLSLLYGEEFFKKLLPLDFELFGMHIRGFVSDPKLHFSNKNRQILGVNKRLIKSPLVYRALQDAYNRYIPHGTFPSYFLDVSVSPTDIDVNVHPRKLEIRFAYEQEVYRALYNGLSSRLEKLVLISNPSQGEGEVFAASSGKEVGEKYYSGSGTRFTSNSPYTNRDINPAQASIDFTKILLWNTQIFSEAPFPSQEIRVIGQFCNSYILVEKEKKLIILDQHALAERVLYEKLVKNQTEIHIQPLLVPENISLSPQEVSLIQHFQTIFQSMGFSFEVFPRWIILQTIPDFVKKQDLQNLISWIISDIQAGNIRSKILEEVKNKVFAYTACRSAIKFGHILSQFEMEALVEDAGFTYSSTCPHGRPVIFEIGIDDLKGKFDR